MVSLPVPITINNFEYANVIKSAIEKGSDSDENYVKHQ